MSAGTRVALSDARRIADEVMDALWPSTHRIEVAGSIRRGRPDVGDIELVAEPIVSEVPDGMFATTSINRLTEAIDYSVEGGLLANHPTDRKRGERYSKVVHRDSGLQVDVFSVLPPASWGVLLLIRTGPADYSHRLVTDARKRGLHVGGGALHRGGLGCGTFTCEVVPTDDERDVLAALGLPWTPPEERA